MERDFSGHVARMVNVINTEIWLENLKESECLGELIVEG
jgi:hypothetical protein